MAGRPKGHEKSGGRKKGTPNKRTAALIDIALAEGITPLEVRLRLMRHFWSQAVDAEGNIINEECAVNALKVSDSAMPYVHPRLSNVEMNANLSPYDRMTDEELVERMRALDGRLQELRKPDHSRSGA